MKIKNLLLLSILSLSLISCTNTNSSEANNVIYANPGEGNFIADQADPLEAFNRRMYHFNYEIERIIITPIVNTYKFITPDFVEDRVSNFFKNAKVLNKDLYLLHNMQVLIQNLHEVLAFPFLKPHQKVHLNLIQY